MSLWMEYRMSSKKERLDKLIVERGLAPSRERARALVMAGMVVVDDHLAEKPGTSIAVTATIRLKGEVHPYVSRGGMKLAKALEEFEIGVAGMTVMDLSLIHI